jgi:hypothetical protein
MPRTSCLKLEVEDRAEAPSLWVILAGVFEAGEDRPGKFFHFSLVNVFEKKSSYYAYKILPDLLRSVEAFHFQQHHMIQCLMERCLGKVLTS